MKRLNFSQLICATAIGVSLTACGGAGVSKGFRADVAGQMQSIQAPLAQCYTEVLQRHRSMKGTLILSFQVQSKTGQFMHARVARSEVKDGPFEACVVAHINSLKLATPEKTTIKIGTYPIQFSHLNP